MPFRFLDVKRKHPDAVLLVEVGYKVGCTGKASLKLPTPVAASSHPCILPIACACWYQYQFFGRDAEIAAKVLSIFCAAGKAHSVCVCVRVRVCACVCVCAK